jgi:hypothetical protein
MLKEDSTAVYKDRPQSAEEGSENVTPIKIVQTDNTKMKAGVEKLFCKIRAVGRRYLGWGQTSGSILVSAIMLVKKADEYH